MESGHLPELKPRVWGWSWESRVRQEYDVASRRHGWFGCSITGDDLAKVDETCGFSRVGYTCVGDAGVPRQGSDVEGHLDSCHGCAHDCANCPVDRCFDLHDRLGLGLIDRGISWPLCNMSTSPPHATHTLHCCMHDVVSVPGLASFCRKLCNVCCLDHDFIGEGVLLHGL